MPTILTGITSPMLTTSSTLFTRKGASSEICTNPSILGAISTIAPNSKILDTTPFSKISPAWYSWVISLTIRAALFAPSSFLPVIKTVPSCSMSISAPVSLIILFIIFPPGPTTSRILSGLIMILIILGACLESSFAGSEIAFAIVSKICNLAFFAFSSASFNISAFIPSTFTSIWMAVTPFFVPATLKSMSPWWSSGPWMSVKSL